MVQPEYSEKSTGPEFSHTPRTVHEDWIVGMASEQLNIVYERALGNGTDVSFLRTITHFFQDPLSKFPDVYQKIGRRDAENDRILPSFTESIDATTERLLFLSDLKKIPQESIHGIVLGGSLSYGRFYNIRKGFNGSDIDLFYIVTPEFFSEPMPKKLLIEIGFKQEQLEEFESRTKKFPQLAQIIPHLMMSHKFELPTCILSLKILPMTVFQYEFVDILQSVQQNIPDLVLRIPDFKPDHYTLDHFTQYNFLHEPMEIPIEEEIVHEAVITHIPAVAHRDGHLHTGDHHNHLMPCFDILYGNENIHQIISQFHQLLRNTVRREREWSPDARVINGHIRKSVLSPQMLEKVAYDFL